MSDLKGQFQDATTALDFMLSGRAILTLKSQVTGDHYTFKITKVENAERWFVSYLAGSDNENDYSYLGVIDGRDRYVRLTSKSRLSDDSAPVKTIRYAVGHITKNNQIGPGLEIWHEGCCGRCGRTLTHPESVERGFGPECIKRIMCEAA